MADDGSNEYSEYKQDKHTHNYNDWSSLRMIIKRILDNHGMKDLEETGFAHKYVTYADDI